MSFLVILRGPPGVGKTTIAKKVAEDIKGSYIDGDRLYAKNHMEAYLWPPYDSERNFLEVIQDAILTPLEGGTPIVLDWMFPQVKDEQVQRVCWRFVNFAPRVFTLQAPLELCLARNAERENSLPEETVRHWHENFEWLHQFEYADGVLLRTDDKPIDELTAQIVHRIRHPQREVPTLEHENLSHHQV